MPLLPKKYRQYLGLGVEIAATIALPLAMGFAADYFFDTAPWFTLLGIITGIVLFILTVVRISDRLKSDE